MSKHAPKLPKLSKEKCKFVLKCTTNCMVWCGSHSSVCESVIFPRMSLSAETVAVLKACHPLLKDGREVVGAAFYRRLFEENPQVSRGDLGACHRLVQVKVMFPQSEEGRRHQALALSGTAG